MAQRTGRKVIQKFLFNYKPDMENKVPQSWCKTEGAWDPHDRKIPFRIGQTFFIAVISKSKSNVSPHKNCSVPGE